MRNAVAVQASCAALLIAMGGIAPAYASPPEELPRREGEALWSKASRSIGTQIHGIRSLQGRYTYRIYDSVTGRHRDYRVNFAFEDGLLIDSQAYSGKSHQFVETAWAGGGDEMTLETASPGGREGEVRRRDAGRSIIVGRKGDMPLLSCSLPHHGADYGSLEDLLEEKPAAQLVRVVRFDEERVAFEVASQVAKYRMRLTCDPSKAFMPQRIETWVSWDGPERRFKTTEVTSTGLSAPDGSTWYYPTSGRVIAHQQTGDVVVDEWEAEISSLVVNADIPDQRFLLKPADDESLIRDGDFKVIQSRRVQPPQTAPASNPARQEAIAAGTAQKVYGSGNNWWRTAGLSVGIAMIAAGVVVLFRRKGA